MVDFFLYEQTGKIVLTGQCIDDDLHLQKHENAKLEIGKADYYAQYFKNGKLKNYPLKPDWFYDFDFEKETWVINVEEANNQALIKRNKLLADGPDRISPIWYNAMTDAQKQEWAQYRQDLLDITQQPDYPNVIIWPEKPSEGA